MDELIESGFVPEQDVYLSYSDCEETGGPGAEMARDWFKAHGVKPYVVVDEGGAIVEKIEGKTVKDACMVGIIEKGYADVKFIARGKGGHSSQPPKNTPIARLGALVNYCEKHTIFKTRQCAPAKAMVKGLANVVKYPSFLWRIALTPCIAKRIVPGYGKSLYSTTMVFTMMNGATASNIIPQEAWVNANLRFSPNDNPEKCIEKLRKIAKKFDCEIEVKRCREASPMVDLTSDGYNTFANAVKKTYKYVEVVPYYMFGGTDCRTMQEIATTAIRCTPCRMSSEQLGTMHASNENLYVNSLGETVSFFKTFMTMYK